MDILIIGGTRFVGPHIIRVLLSAGHVLTMFNRGVHKSSVPDHVRHIEGNRENDLSRVQGHFDLVIDMCAYQGEHVEKLYSEVSFNKYILMSSAAVYAESDVFPLIEDRSPMGPCSMWGEYNKGKVAAEQVVVSRDVSYAIIRPVYILGENNSHDRENFIYSRIKKRIPIRIPGNEKSIAQFVFVQDVARMIGLMVEQDLTGVFNCSGDEYVTLEGLVKSMGRIVGIEPIFDFSLKGETSLDEKEFPFGSGHFFCSNEKIKKYGMEFTPLITGLEHDYQSYYASRS